MASSSIVHKGTRSSTTALRTDSIIGFSTATKDPLLRSSAGGSDQLFDSGQDGTPPSGTRLVVPDREKLRSR